MKQSAVWLAAVGALVPGSATPVELSAREVAALELLARAAPANQPNGYTPQTVTCPSARPTIRSAAELSQNETEWLEVRRRATVDPLRTLLARLNITGLDTDQYINNNQNNASALPNIGIAASGGGYRAMLNGAGILQAFDSRTPGSENAGHLGGLLQASTYVAGLSGGSWLLSSLYVNNYTSVDAIISQDTSADDSGGVWQLGNSIFEGPEEGGLQILNTAGYFADLVDSVSGKRNAGFNTTLTDYWGRALSYQMVNATNGGPDYTWSSIAEQDWFTRGDAPMPLVVVDSRNPGETIISTNSTVFTVTPWEIGSDDPTLYAFAPLKYVGTNFTDGSPRNDEQCVVGFDNVGYVFGTSSSLFNAILATVNGTQTTGLLSSALQAALQGVLVALGQDEEDIADWVNPFFGYNNDTNVNHSDDTLTLVDGGLDGQNIPLHPLIQPNRNVDVIFAIDSSADTNGTAGGNWPTPESGANWPDGTSILTTYQRSQSDIGNGTAFPEVPSRNTIMNLGLASKPTFFGCDTSNFTDQIPPLLVYMPNGPYVFNSNTSTFGKLDYNDTERNAMVLNAYNMATQGNGTLAGFEDWSTCVGCAILSRSLERTNTDVPEVCTQCFSKYCWNGTVDDSTPGTYDPALKLPQDEVKVTSGSTKVVGSLSLAVLTAITAGLAML
ncbi:putative lysophospholipase, catalytic domain, Acyl transferase/acyl hydrolase/lysophospholipase [Septoria linicola]|nr:putative lysophospholipase, catalytic domain, Acyl transferase/acyl hydrolase/lysophospholipase [Septoria linicola]